jgi:Flp pilus assembly pilin Flp
MSCFHSRRPGTEDRRPKTGRSLSPIFRLPFLRDERGAAAIEGLVVLAVLAGVFFANQLISNWGTSLQFGQMGARLLAFDAGDVQLAKLGKTSSRQAVQKFESTSWDTISKIDPTTSGWLNGMFVLSNDRFSASVADTAEGRLPGQTRSLAHYGPATMSYFTKDWSAAANPWVNAESTVGLQFLNISYYVGRHHVSPSVIDSTYAVGIPNTIPLVETIYSRVGVR